MEIELKNIHKAFGSNEVLKGVNLTLKSGEVHALMGENGAGKSTLMNILTGIHKQDKGQIFVDGQEVSFKNPLEAEAHGIAFIHQELNIWPNLSILENLFMMHSITNGMGVLDFKAMRKLAEEKCREIEIELPLDMEAGECSVGQQQMTEIVRNLLVDAKVVIMDEPTAALTERETEKLFEVMRSLKKRGVAMVYISHRMEEVTANCDTITVMRDGVSVATKSVKEYGMEQIIRDMVGRSITEFYPDRRNKPAEVILEVKSFNQTGVFRDVSFNLRKGEILGVAGLMGAGRTEIMRAIFGVDPHESGELVFKGEPLKITKPEDAIKAGMAFVTENRKTEGLILDFSILRNIALPSVDTFAKNSVINFGKLSGFADEMAKKLGVKAHSLELEAGALSGGNQQKVVIAKWVGMNPDVIIMDEPTRGIDVGAKRDIYELMNELTASGVSIIMVSSELPEVLGMSDRILVVHEGRIAGELLRDEADQEKIMTLATGGK
ncbi:MULTISPECIES: sugar ABC transporter ATP-binding protein [Phascolarctobacterium]|uniref:sugar ABC transporter ATP-binding protein n=1 Tax=Phascolarctobacterium TaxID=33024 RepID=UPI0026F1262E|nr:sugar ABC transporter ATP-binding protein [Phascolarctobacterium succinatutens]